MLIESAKPGFADVDEPTPVEIRPPGQSSHASTGCSASAQCPLIVSETAGGSAPRSSATLAVLPTAFAGGSKRHSAERGLWTAQHVRCNDGRYDRDHANDDHGRYPRGYAQHGGDECGEADGHDRRRRRVDDCTSRTMGWQSHAAHTRREAIGAGLTSDRRFRQREVPTPPRDPQAGSAGARERHGAGVGWRGPWRDRQRSCCG